MPDTHHPDWDDDELVPMGDLRPSRNGFGPVGSRDDEKSHGHQGVKPHRPEHANHSDKSGERRPRPSQRSAQASRQSQPPPRNARRPVRREQEIDLRNPRPQNRDRRPEARQEPRPQARREQRPQDERPQPRDRRPEARPEPRPQARREPRPQDARPQARDRRPEGRPQQRRDHPQQHHQQVDVKPSSIRDALNRITGNGPEELPVEIQEYIDLPVTDGTVAVFSRKGGVGKTTISAYLGLTLASLRGGRILAIDGDAEAGSLGWLMAPSAPATLAALSTAHPVPSSYQDLRAFTASAGDNLDVIVGDTDGREVVDQTGLEEALVQVARNYDISIFDTGGGVSVSAARVLIKQAKVMLLVMGPSIDSIRAAERTLAWIDERPGEAAAQDVRIIAVINGVPNSVKEAQVQRIEDHFAERCEGVVRIPWDEFLAEGTTEASLESIGKETRKAFATLAATTVEIMSRVSQRRGGRRAS